MAGWGRRSDPLQTWQEPDGWTEPDEARMMRAPLFLHSDKPQETGSIRDKQFGLAAGACLPSRSHFRSLCCYNWLKAVMWPPQMSLLPFLVNHWCLHISTVCAENRLIINHFPPSPTDQRCSSSASHVDSGSRSNRKLHKEGEHSGK